MNVCIIDIYNPELNEKFRNFNDYYIVKDDEGNEKEPNLFHYNGIIN